MPQNACGCDHARRGADKRAEHIGIAASELAHEEGRWQRAQRKAEIEQADGQRDEGGIGRQFLADQATQRNHDGGLEAPSACAIVRIIILRRAAVMSVIVNPSKDEIGTVLSESAFASKIILLVRRIIPDRFSWQPGITGRQGLWPRTGTKDWDNVVRLS